MNIIKVLTRGSILLHLLIYTVNMFGPALHLRFETHTAELVSQNLCYPSQEVFPLGAPGSNQLGNLSIPPWFQMAKG